MLAKIATHLELSALEVRAGSLDLTGFLAWWRKGELFQRFNLFVN